MQNTVPFTLVNDTTPIPRSKYTYLHPKFPDSANDNQNTLTALREYNRRRSEYPRVPTKNRELALIKKQPGRTPAFIVASTPLEILAPGMIVECLGAMQGNWEVTNRVERCDRGIYTLWVRYETMQKTWVRTDANGAAPSFGYDFKKLSQLLFAVCFRKALPPPLYPLPTD